ncbi:Inner membrane protein YrbG [Jannaschia seosinensis]|uniref:Inner membrane protein YrbG n=1 Tax=Jannaschia seosinensis TaxID=313367 RepID=A0A0M7B6I3_9RHOB|nr:sodium:calcium antiporter [Jannaschia seosinensis]CUH24008.1 Inner membrane protein YrbG [Jannaschia seosinensis]
MRRDGLPPRPAIRTGRPDAAPVGPDALQGVALGPDIMAGTLPSRHDRRRRPGSRTAPDASGPARGAETASPRKAARPVRGTLAAAGLWIHELPHQPENRTAKRTAMFAQLSNPILLGLFAAASIVVFVASFRMTRLADIIADRTGLGEAIAGGVFLGAATSLSGLTVSATAAWGGDASLAVSNGVGGIAAQTVFLAVADLTLRKANLEHAAAEPANLFQAALLMALLTLPVMAFAMPAWSIWGVHPVSVVMAAGYLYGVRVSHQVREAPMWEPISTPETRTDEPEDEEEPGRDWRGPALAFAGLAALLALSGWVISSTASVATERFGMSSSLVGALATALVTSMPELVTTVTAVRRGALQLAVGGIIGGNTFDTMFLVISDGFYREGPIFNAMNEQDLYWLATGLLMTAILIAGLIRRQKQGPGGIGVETVLLIAVYLGAVGVQAFR